MSSTVKNVNGLEEKETATSTIIKNPYIQTMKPDVMCHLRLDNEHHNLKNMFGDIKYVCFGGRPTKMKQFAELVRKEIGEQSYGTKLENITERSSRYALYKVGPVLCVSHGIGMPSVGIILHEIIKILHHANVKDPIFFRTGTSGGIGVDPGTVVVSSDTVNDFFEPVYKIVILGKSVERPAILNNELAKELLMSADKNNNYKTIIGKTMCTTEFYEGSGRMDGAFCYYTESEKLQFYKDLESNGIKNIEMESVTFAAITHFLGIKAAVACVVINDRCVTDKVVISQEDLDEFQIRPFKLVSKYISFDILKNSRK